MERLLALLEEARAELWAGWVQDGWWSRPAADGRQILETGLAAGHSVPATAHATCLVGALIRAGSGQGGDSEAGRAIDAVYDALWESRNQPAATPGQGLLRVSSPQVRQAKVQALTRWNDAGGRTTGEVLAILDRAIARVIQNLAQFHTAHAVQAACQPGDSMMLSSPINAIWKHSQGNPARSDTCRTSCPAHHRS